MKTSATNVCTSCGTPMDDSSAEFGCMVCLLQAGMNQATEQHDAASAAPLEVPEQFGVYLIARREDGSPWELGRGAMGVTYRAIDTTLDRPVALKIIQNGHRASNAEARERFVREARAAAALRHPNVATVYQFGIREETGQCFYAMEVVEGETLDDRVRRTGPLDLRTTLEVAAQVTDALAAAEKRGLVHRDLKPGNIMAVGDEKDGRILVKVIDFGVAKAITRGTDAMSLTQGGFVGTPAFASPEQFARGPIDVRSDIYSLGVTLWYLLTGQMPFRGQTVEELREAQRTTPLPVGQLKAAHVPRRLISLLESMLALAPAARPDTNTLSTRLKACGTQLTGRRKRTLVFALIVASVAALLALLLSNPGKSTAKKSIAVLPFEDLSGDRENTNFVGGIQDDIVTNLSKIGQLKVIPRSSVLIYKATPHNVREIAQTLGVSTVLEGSVRRSGNRVRINVQLIDAANDEQIWAEGYERDITDAFAIQSDVALKIASKLQANLSAKQTAQLQDTPTRSGEAYLLYLEANDIFGGYEKLQPDLEKAEKLYEKTMALDPSFALAFAKLSQLETIYYDMYERAPARLSKAKAAADEALRLQSGLPEGHMALGRYYWQGDKIDYEKALAEYTTALRALPNSAEIYSVLGRIERAQKKWSHALVNLEKAATMDPNSLERWHRLFATYEATRDYPAAARALGHVLTLDPDSWRYHEHQAFLELFWKGDLRPLEAMLTRERTQQDGLLTVTRFGIEMLLRRYDEAEKLLLADSSETFSLNGLRPIPKSFFLGKVYLCRGDISTARTYFENAAPSIERSVQEHSMDANWHLLLAEAYAGLGRKDDAIPEAKRANEITPDFDNELVGLGILDGLAGIYVSVNEPDLALPIIEHSLSTPGGMHAQLLRLNPLWDPLRADPRFQKLLDAAIGPEANDANNFSKSIAVLPFENLSDDKQNAYFASGIHDDILVNLLKIGDLKVISRDSVKSYDASSGDLRAIAKALGVTTILKGNVRRIENRARINVQLINAVKGEQIWAENYDREITDVFAIQSDLALQIASALQAKLSPGETARLRRSPTQSGEAYLLYIQANEIAGRYGTLLDDQTKAEQLFEKAIQLDPSFALAFAQLSQLEIQLNEMYDPASARYEKAVASAREALRLQPDLPEAHMAMGRCYAKEDWSAPAVDAEKATAEFALALRGAPNDARILTAIGRIERHQGRWAESTAHLEKAAALDPNNVERWHRLFFNHEITRNFAAAWKALDRVLALEPDSWYYYSHQAALLFFWKGDLRGYERMLSRPLSGKGPEGFYTVGRHGIYKRLGRLGEAERVLLEDPQENFSRNGLYPIPKTLLLAHVYAQQHRAGKARACFEAAKPSIERTVEQRPLDAGWHVVAAELYAGLGRKQDALREAKRATEIVPETDKFIGAGMRDQLALIYIQVGEPDLALPILERSLKEPAGFYVNELRLDPIFEPLRGDARFQKLLAEPDVVMRTGAEPMPQ